MTTLTKTECEEILERLSDKSLTKGCLIKMEVSGRILEFLGARGLHITFWDGVRKTAGGFSKIPGSEFEILGYPVTLLDVLERTKDDKRDWVTYSGGLIEPVQYREDIGTPTQELLIVFWSPLGFKTSLQSILNLIEWESISPRLSGGRELQKQLVAQASPATNLFLFLKQINL